MSYKKNLITIISPVFIFSFCFIWKKERDTGTESYPLVYSLKDPSGQDWASLKLRTQSWSLVCGRNPHYYHHWYHHWANATAPQGRPWEEVGVRARSRQQTQCYGPVFLTTRAEIHTLLYLCFWYLIAVKTYIVILYMRNSECFCLY